MTYSIMTYRYGERMEKLEKLIKMKENELDLIEIYIDIDYAFDFDPFEELEKKKAELKKIEREYEELSNILI